MEELLAELDTLLSETMRFIVTIRERGRSVIFCWNSSAAVSAAAGNTGCPTGQSGTRSGKNRSSASLLLKLRREMTPDEYLAFEVYVVEGKPAREAAVLSSLSPGMVYLVKTRALKRLRVLRHEFEAV